MDSPRSRCSRSDTDGSMAGWLLVDLEGLEVILSRVISGFTSVTG